MDIRTKEKQSEHILLLPVKQRLTCFGRMESCVAQKNDKPNILWICSDQQRFDTLGCYGNTFVKTPVLDKLARDGVCFTNAFSQSPVCTPSRGSFLTGRYPVTSRTRQNGADIPETEVLVTKILHDAGYVCGLAGKLHLSACHPKSGCTQMERRIDDGYDEFHWSHDTASLWGTHNEYYAWLEQKFGTTYKRTDRIDTKWVQNGPPAEQSQSAWCAEKAIEFIEKQSAGVKPWLFSINMYDPHHPFDPPESYLNRYLPDLDKIPLPNYAEGELADKPLWQNQDRNGAYGGNDGYRAKTMTDRDHRLIRAAYWAMCDLIDDQTGRILQALEKTGQLENTIVIYMSDHGELLGDHGAYLKGPFFYEPCVKVPLIMSWKGHLKPLRREALVQLMDLPQTLLDLCGIPQYDGMQGKSLVPLLESTARDVHHESVYCEYLNAMPWNHPKAFASMVRNNRYKLVCVHNDKSGELYDLCADPNERVNLYHEPEYLPIKAALLEELLRHWSYTADPVPVRKSDW